MRRNPSLPARPFFVFFCFFDMPSNGHADNTPTPSHLDDDPSVPASQDEVAIMRVERALSALRSGVFVVVLDGEDRENEGDLIIAAQYATTERIAFMVNETSGLICVAITPQRCEELSLPQMVPFNNNESHGTAFCVSVDYEVGMTTGISAQERAATIRALANPLTEPQKLRRPGHMFPLRARAGGVLERPGHTETSVDLMRLAGLIPAGALCEIVNKDGSMARPPQCREFSRRHGLVCLTIADIIRYRCVKKV